MEQRPIKRLMTARIFSILAGMLYSCGGGGSYGGSSAAPAVPSPSPATSTDEVVACPASGTSAMSIVSMVSPGFSPNSLTVPVNTTMKWTNNDAILHTVTSTTVPASGTFDQQVSPGTSVCLKFTSAGTFNYHCSIHPATMIGVVTIQ